MKNCFVYIIRIDGGDLRKIGISEQPSSRLATLCTGSPFRMTIEKLYRFPSRREAQAIESRFHTRNFADRTRGEWFSIDYGSSQDRLNVIIAEYLILDSGLDEAAFEPAMATRGIEMTLSPLYWFEREALAA